MSSKQQGWPLSFQEPGVFPPDELRRRWVMPQGTTSASTTPFNRQISFSRSFQAGSNIESINGVPAEEWHSMSDDRRRAFMLERRKNSAFKTELCKGFLIDRFCSYGDACRFAHHNDELRPRFAHPKYKTELCRSFAQNGRCAYGSRCQFIHRSPDRKGQFVSQLNCSAPPASRFSFSLQQQQHRQPSRVPLESSSGASFFMSQGLPSFFAPIEEELPAASALGRLRLD